MNLPSPADIDPVITATWTPQTVSEIANVTLRDGGGGQRATAATVNGPVDLAHIEEAEAKMSGRAEALFRVRSDQPNLQSALEKRGYQPRDTTNILVGLNSAVADMALKPVSAFAIWPPLAIMDEMWEATGTTADRRANMQRVVGPKTAILGRGSDQPAGIGFVAIHGDCAMLHAFAVMPDLRRQKIAQNMVICAAQWARENGAKWLCALCVADNPAANALYQNLGMRAVGSYHYRFKPNFGH